MVFVHSIDSWQPALVCARNNAFKLDNIKLDGKKQARVSPHRTPHRTPIGKKREKKSLTPGWVVYGKRRHAELPEGDVPPQMYPW
jgi:hypothetical protein